MAATGRRRELLQTFIALLRQGLSEGGHRFENGQLRTLQRRVRQWAATSGPPKEVFFTQIHHPGRLAASDFTHMMSLGVTIGGQPFDHMVHHFVLTYSNWETASICFSESFESLSDGLQQALWELGGAPQRHRSDRMSAAVNNLSEKKEFTRRYQSLMNHYGLTIEKINARQAHENGDVEQSHNRFKEAVDQALLLRGSCDFSDRPVYTLGSLGRSRTSAMPVAKSASLRRGPCCARSRRRGWRATSEQGFGLLPGASFGSTGMSTRLIAD